MKHEPPSGTHPEFGPEADWSLTPIGHFHGDRRYPYEAPRQGVFAPDRNFAAGQVRLLPHRNFEQALADLAGFNRIWLLFGFHRSPRVDPSGAWKPRVRPPRHSDHKVGVFATRSPHRPAGLGLSCVRLVRVDGLNLHVDETDLLDGSPVFDIKPYVPAYDSFPEARAGWTETGEEQDEVSIRYSDSAREQARFLTERGGPDLLAFASLQLAFRPTDPARKRVRPGERPGTFVLAYRTWRIGFHVTEADPATVLVSELFSGYEPAEREPDAPDPYGDLELHRAFVDRFGS